MCERKVVAFAVDLPRRPEKWKIRSLGIKNAALWADGYGREVIVRAPDGWGSRGARRIWRLKSPASGLKAGPLESRRSLDTYLPNSAASPSNAGLEFEVSSFDPRPFFVSWLGDRPLVLVGRHKREPGGRQSIPRPTLRLLRSRRGLLALPCAQRRFRCVRQLKADPKCRVLARGSPLPPFR